MGRRPPRSVALQPTSELTSCSCRQLSGAAGCPAAAHACCRPLGRRTATRDSTPPPVDPSCRLHAPINAAAASGHHCVWWRPAALEVHGAPLDVVGGGPSDRSSAGTGRGGAGPTAGMKCCVSLVLLFVCLLQGVAALQMVEHVIPSHLILGQSADFVCRYRLQNETLYSVKWYKDNEQFYNLIAAPKIAKRMYPVPGVRIDMAQSTSERVRLVDVDFGTAGKYGCEVSVDAPSFHTVIAVGQVIVVALPERGPEITGGADFYRLGDRLQVNCTAHRSKPAALLNWHVNGQQAAYQSLAQYPVQTSPRHGLETRRLGLQLTLQRRHFVDGLLRLRCTAALATLYSRHVELMVALPPRTQLPPAKTLEVKEHNAAPQLPDRWVSALVTSCLVAHWMRSTLR